MPVERISTHLGAGRDSLIDWLVFLSNAPETQIICWNLLRDLASGASPKPVLLGFLAALNEQIETDTLFYTRSLRAVFSGIRRDLNHQVCLKGALIAGNRDGECCFTTSEGKNTVVRLCRIVKAGKFADMCQPTAPAFLEDPVEGLNGQGTVLCTLDSKGRGFLFATRWDEVEKFIEEKYSDSDSWERLLRRLGMPNHYNDSGQESGSYVSINYVVIIYPESFKPSRLTKPTFIDGGENPAFCLDMQPNTWGSTLSLDNPSPGLPEAVHCPYVTTTVTYRTFAVGGSPKCDYRNILDYIRI